MSRASVVVGLLTATLATPACSRSPDDQPNPQAVRSQAVPSVGSAPTGISAALWDEVAWFPTPMFALSEFTRPESAAVVQWLANVVPDVEPCQRALAGIDHYFLVAAGTHTTEPTHVLYGATRRSDVEACAVTVGSGHNYGAVQSDGAVTRVRVDGHDTWLLWMALGDHSVIVADRARERVEAFAGAGAALATDGAFVEGLTHIDRDADTWSISRRDVTGDVLGAPSELHAFSISGLTAESPMPRPISLEAWARFATTADAQRAKRGLDRIVTAHLDDGGTAVAQTDPNRPQLTVQATLPSMAALARIVGRAP